MYIVLTKCPNKMLKLLCLLFIMKMLTVLYDFQMTSSAVLLFTLAVVLLGSASSSPMFGLGEYFLQLPYLQSTFYNDERRIYNYPRRWYLQLPTDHGGHIKGSHETPLTSRQYDTVSYRHVSKFWFSY